MKEGSQPCARAASANEETATGAFVRSNHSLTDSVSAIQLEIQRFFDLPTARLKGQERGFEDRVFSVIFSEWVTKQLLGRRREAASGERFDMLYPGARY